MSATAFEEATARRSLSVLSARMIQDGRPCVAALGAFAAAYETVAEFAQPAPVVAAPQDVERIEVRESRFSLLGRLERLAPAPTVDLTLHFRNAPAPGADGHVLARFESRTAAEGYFEEDGWLWSLDGVLLAQSRQIALLRQPREDLPADGHPGCATGR